MLAVSYCVVLLGTLPDTLAVDNILKKNSINATRRHVVTRRRVTFLHFYATKADEWTEMFGRSALRHRRDEHWMSWR